MAKERGAQLESTVVIPETYNGLPVVKIAEYAFCDDFLYVSMSSHHVIYDPNYDYVIQKIVLPDTIEEIGVGAFALCGVLKEVNIPEGVKTIGRCTFFHCGSLNNIILPSTLETIGKEAFGSSALTEITIPESVKTIGDIAFGYCIKLQQI